MLMVLERIYPRFSFGKVVLIGLQRISVRKNRKIQATTSGGVIRLAISE